MIYDLNIIFHFDEMQNHYTLKNYKTRNPKSLSISTKCKTFTT